MAATMVTIPGSPSTHTMTVARLLQPNDAAELAAPAADLPVETQHVPALCLGDVPPEGPVPPHQPTPSSDVPATPEPPPIIIDPEKGVIAPVQLPTPPHPAQRAAGNAGARP